MFFWFKCVVLNRCEEEEKCEENWAIFRSIYILQTTKLIFFKFGMRSRVYGGHKICKFDRNQSSGYRDMMC